MNALCDEDTLLMQCWKLKTQLVIIYVKSVYLKLFKLQHQYYGKDIDCNISYLSSVINVSV